MRTLPAALSVALVAIGAATSIADRRPKPIIVPGGQDPCKGAAASATLTLDAYESAQHALSPATGYGTPACDRYVVDIHVPAEASRVPICFSPQFEISGGELGMSLGATVTRMDEQTCTSFSEAVTIYKRIGIQWRAWSSFTRSGRWEAARSLCWITPTRLGRLLYFDVVYGAPPASGADVYRVAVRSAASGAVRPVSVRIVHTAFGCSDVLPDDGPGAGPG